MAHLKDFRPEIAEIIAEAKGGMSVEAVVEKLERMLSDMNANERAWSSEVASYNANSNPG